MEGEEAGEERLAADRGRLKERLPRSLLWGCLQIAPTAHMAWAPHATLFHHNTKVALLHQVLSSPFLIITACEGKAGKTEVQK